MAEMWVEVIHKNCIQIQCLIEQKQVNHFYALFSSKVVEINDRNDCERDFDISIQVCI